MTPGPTQLIIVGFLYLLPLVALILIVRRSLKRSDRAAEEAGGYDASARQTLDRRYAEGEISRDEYLRIRDDMTKDQNAR
jgi:uncharacterized membrane protein